MAEAAAALSSFVGLPLRLFVVLSATLMLVAFLGLTDRSTGVASLLLEAWSGIVLKVVAEELENDPKAVVG